ncbi:MAG: biopolymer transporter ExbD [Aquificae bacterium]|nr:biopolymer transporter ExbD [Aquificota bacterium]
MEEDREFSSINVIPLVDIMLVLLTIVLTTATFIVQGTIPVSLPEAEGGEKSARVEEVVLTITRDGRFFFGNRLVSLKELEEYLRKLPRESALKIRADEEARVGSLVKVLDLVNRYNFKNVSLAVRIR